MAVAPLALAALLASVAGLADARAVNISSVWLLPEEGFPVFYRYFRDRITWFEADAVCQFHHANLVTVDSSEQFDATRAYLKEMDVATSVWVGLKRSGARGEFSWTDYKPLENGGYWQEQIPLTEDPVCAALDPAADYRWHPQHCGGPEVASFICQLEVPSWARKEDGCMLTSLPSLTVSYMPEQGAVELISDCGLEGTRRIACKGQANRDEMIKRLSCESAGTEPTTGGTGSEGWDEANEVPTATRHRRDTDVTADMASARTPPTTEGMTEVSSTDASKNIVPEETKQTPVATSSTTQQAPVIHDVIASSTQQALVIDDVAVISTQQPPVVDDVTSSSTQQPIPVMSAAEEPIRTSGEVTDDQLNESELPAFNRSKEIAKDEDALEAEMPIQIPLNTIARLTSEEATGGAAEGKQQSGERRVVAVQSKPIPPSLRGHSPFVEPNKTESGEPGDATTAKPAEKESHEEFRESKVEVAPQPEKTDVKQANFPPLSVYKVTDDRDPDESSSRVQPAAATEREDAATPTAEAKFFTRVVAEETATTGTTGTTPAPPKADTGNDFFVVTDAPLKVEGRPAALTEEREELEPEAPERPNRGRLLVRPQRRSFYPYFLNRVLG